MTEGRIGDVKNIALSKPAMILGGAIALTTPFTDENEFAK